MAASGEQSRADTQTWEQFLAVIEREAQRQYRGWDQDAQEDYVKRMAKRAHCLQREAVLSVTDVSKAESRFSSVRRTRTYEVVGISLRAGDGLPAHNHPEMTGVLLCVTGSLQVEQFDKTGAVPEGGSLFRRYSSRRLNEGDTSTFTASHHNVHSVVAIEDTQILDIFTPPYTPKRMRSTQWYKLDRLGADDPEVFKGVLLSE